MSFSIRLCYWSKLKMVLKNDINTRLRFKISFVEEYESVAMVRRIGEWHFECIQCEDVHLRGLCSLTVWLLVHRSRMTPTCWCHSHLKGSSFTVWHREAQVDMIRNKKHFFRTPKISWGFICNFVHSCLVVCCFLFLDCVRNALAL